MATPATTQFPIINVVPAGYRWTAESSAKARQKGSFLRVGGPLVTKRFLSGAKRSWSSADPAEQNTIFHTGYRITGPVQAVIDALTYANISNADIQQVLNGVITRDNYMGTMAQVYEQELIAREKAKAAKPGVEGYELKNIIWFAVNLKDAEVRSKSGERQGAASAPGRNSGDSIAEKVKKIAPGKVIDVSMMDINTGKGHRTANQPKTAKSGKFGVTNIPIISNDINKYIRGLQLAYGGDVETTYADAIAFVRRAIANNGTVAPVGGMVVPVGGMVIGAAAPPDRLPSPPRRQATTVPGAQIAAVPQFLPIATGVPNVVSPGRPTVIPGGVGAIGGRGLPQIPALGGLTGLRQ